MQEKTKTVTEEITELTETRELADTELQHVTGGFFKWGGNGYGYGYGWGHWGWGWGHGDDFKWGNGWGWGWGWGHDFGDEIE
ncbi:hypothetical protein KDH_74970 [Dictyobacter sp. S3.2.2.5]|uniref:Uncharacterized protein n=1 Tax=Dictyobacter halimunensis TaxID=3026934 RepID=A0ABQ6G4C9_9CHLR|nr:hypothetical protein KDH_74970 [Dictyobacter sp. S3.2.2.5]